LTDTHRAASVQVEADRPPKQLFYIPTLLLLGLIVMLQRRRRAVDPFEAVNA